MSKKGTLSASLTAAQGFGENKDRIEAFRRIDAEKQKRE